MNGLATAKYRNSPPVPEARVQSEELVRLRLKASELIAWWLEHYSKTELDVRSTVHDRVGDMR